MTSADWTAVGTIALAALTFAALAYTIVTTTRERRQAADDRADAALRLTEERQAGDQRLREERDYAEGVRRRERRADSAQTLIRYIAVLQPHLRTVPGTWSRSGFSGYGPVVRHEGDNECRAAVDTLRHGGWAEASMLGRDDAAMEAARRYRYLVKLVEDLADNEPAKPEGDVRTLRNYSRWVRISLAMLAEDGTIPPIYGGSAEFPLLGLAEHMPTWLPNPIPPGWTDEADELAGSAEAGSSAEAQVPGSEVGQR